MNYYNEIKNKIIDNEVYSKITEDEMLNLLYNDIYCIKRELITLLKVENR